MDGVGKDAYCGSHCRIISLVAFPKRGCLPGAHRAGRSLRWDVSELRAWMKAEANRSTDEAVAQ